MAPISLQIGNVNLPTPKGSVLEADSSTFKQVTFPKPFPKGSNVIVITETQTFKGPPHRAFASTM